MPGPDDETPPSPISPIASVLININIIESVRATVIDALKLKSNNGFESIGQAFVPGESGGNPSIRSAIHEIGSAIVASAVYSAMGGGEVGLPNPDCGGTSLETIPPTLTPVVNVGREVHRVTELPRLKEQLAVAVKFIDRAVGAQSPRGEEVDVVRKQLKMALESLCS